MVNVFVIERLPPRLQRLEWELDPKRVNQHPLCGFVCPAHAAVVNRHVDVAPHLSHGPRKARPGNLLGIEEGAV